MRFPLLDPDRFLDPTVPLVRPLFTVVGFALWLALVRPARCSLRCIGRNSPPTSPIGCLLRRTSCCWPRLSAVKRFHELGHAYATKAGGGEVHELGIMLLVLHPGALCRCVRVERRSGQQWRRVARRRRRESWSNSRSPRLAMIVWADGAPGAAARRRFQRHFDRRRLDADLQRQSAAALRRLLYACPTSSKFPISIRGRTLSPLSVPALRACGRATRNRRSRPRRNGWFSATVSRHFSIVCRVVGIALFVAAQVRIPRRHAGLLDDRADARLPAGHADCAFSR